MERSIMQVSLAAPGWALDVERGPEWLYIRLRPPQQGDAQEVDLAEILWETLEQSFTYRLVLELDEVRLLRSWMIGQLVILHKRIHKHDGTLRLSGLSDINQEALRSSRLDTRFPQYPNRTDAVMGERPPQPR